MMSSTWTCVYVREPRGQPPAAATVPQSRRPLVWLSICRIVIESPYRGSSGKYFRMGSSSDSFPSIASKTTAAAVNCLETEPASKIVAGVLGTSYSRFAIPYARDTIVFPARETPTAHPGDELLIQPAKTASTAATESDCAASGAAVNENRATRILMA